jgi:hypothetical protein
LSKQSSGKKLQLEATPPFINQLSANLTGSTSRGHQHQESQANTIKEVCD